MIEREPIVYAEEWRVQNGREIRLADSVLAHWDNVLQTQGSEALRNGPLVFSVSGLSSGAGKGTAINELEAFYTNHEKLTVYRPKGATTRLMRGPQDFSEYEMLRYPDGPDGEVLSYEEAVERYEELGRAGALREGGSLHNNETGETNWYGRIIDPVQLEQSDVTIIEVGSNGLPPLKYGAEIQLPSGEVFHSEPLAGLISFFVAVPGESGQAMLEELWRRAVEIRGDNPDEIRGRLFGEESHVRREIEEMISGKLPFDHLVLNHDKKAFPLYTAAQGIWSVINKYREARMHKWQDGFMAEIVASYE